MKNNFIIVAMSGGIDSTFSAWLLKKLNYNVTGIYMINWKINKCKKEELKNILLISKFLNIDIKIINFYKIYKKKVFFNFLKNYNLGKTPNPDIKCNKEIKFKILLNYAILLGAKKLATGHYAIIKNINNNYKILTSKDKNKDQTYFLYKLNQYQLSKIIFPLGNIYKKDVRIISKKFKFPNWNQKDSHGICFIENKLKNFLSKYIPYKLGYILNKKNNIIGFNIGIQYYTIGQKKLLNTKNNIFNNNNKYVNRKNITKNIIYISKKNSLWLFSIGIIISNLSWIFKKPKNNNFFTIKVRHSKNLLISLLRYINKKKLLIIFNNPQWGLSTGQSVVIYKNKLCLGGGVIEKSLILFEK